MRAKITTTIEEALLSKAKALAGQEGLSGANAIIERALELYFTSIQGEVWEKSLSSGWIKKLVLKGDSILYENIKCRKTLENCRPDDYTPESLKAKGWKKVQQPVKRPLYCSLKHKSVGCSRKLCLKQKGQVKRIL